MRARPIRASSDRSSTESGCENVFLPRQRVPVSVYYRALSGSGQRGQGSSLEVVIEGRGSPPRWLITGRPGAGKTTVVRRVAAALGGMAGGFTTQEVREDKRRVGFCVEDTAGSAEILAHVDHPTPPSVGRYGVDLEAFERIGIRAVEKAMRERKVLIIDEIGKMELLHPRFPGLVEEALDSGLPVVATVLQRNDRFADRIKRRPGIERIDVTASNRDGLPYRILVRLGEWGGPGGR